jgi:hypothetical protein
MLSAYTSRTAQRNLRGYVVLGSYDRGLGCDGDCSCGGSCGDHALSGSSFSGSLAGISAQAAAQQAGALSKAWASSQLATIEGFATAGQIVTSTPGYQYCPSCSSECRGQAGTEPATVSEGLVARAGRHRRGHRDRRGRRRDHHGHRRNHRRGHCRHRRDRRHLLDFSFASRRSRGERAVHAVRRGARGQQLFDGDRARRAERRGHTTASDRRAQFAAARFQIRGVSDPEDGCEPLQRRVLPGDRAHRDRELSGRRVSGSGGRARRGAAASAPATVPQVAAPPATVPPVTLPVTTSGSTLTLPPTTTPAAASRSGVLPGWAPSALPSWAPLFAATVAGGFLLWKAA